MNNKRKPKQQPMKANPPPLSPPPALSDILSKYVSVDKPYYQTNQQQYPQQSTKPTAAVTPRKTDGTTQYNAMAPPARYEPDTSSSKPQYTYPYKSKKSTGNNGKGFYYGSKEYMTYLAKQTVKATTTPTKPTSLHNKKPYERPVPWAKQNALKTPTPLAGGKGMDMLQKMGWNPGQGLGKKLNGSLEPVLLNIKMDKKGFDVNKRPQKIQVYDGNASKKAGVWRPAKPKTIQIVTEGKHPNSILEEYCSKRKIPSPRYTLILDEGPIHAKKFILKVTVDGVDYPGVTGSNVKAKAKLEAAIICLKKLKLVSEDYQYA